MNNLKFYKFDIEKADTDEITIKFNVKFLKGVDTIVKAFTAGKEIIEGKLASGLMGFINIAGSIYSFIKAGK